MAKITKEQYIIAIGASAGGTEAISVFFDHTPLDSVSYVVIQHLSADFKSQMESILSRHTELEVIEATHNTAILSNTIYLIPSTDFMGIENGHLLLYEKANQPKPHMTIDYFFQSLAVERGDKAIAVVLSGTGKDGSIGIEDIKIAGGIVIVQDPGTAIANEMPFAALNTGFADLILAAEAMPQHIENYVRYGAVQSLNERNDGIVEISMDEIKDIIKLIRNHVRQTPSDYDDVTFLHLIRRRMVQHNFSMVSEYANFLKGSPKEMELLGQECSVY